MASDNSLHVATSRYMLLHLATCCYISLHVATSRYIYWVSGEPPGPGRPPEAARGGAARRHGRRPRGGRLATRRTRHHAARQRGGRQLRKPLLPRAGAVRQAKTSAVLRVASVLESQEVSAV